MSDKRLTHFDESGAAQMVDVSEKAATARIATAEAQIVMQPETLALITEGRAKKGDVIGVARLAGIMGAKKTPDLIPLCHPLMLTSVKVDLACDPARSAVDITATCRLTGQTGVEAFRQVGAFCRRGRRQARDLSVDTRDLAIDPVDEAFDLCRDIGDACLQISLLVTQVFQRRIVRAGQVGCVEKAGGPDGQAKRTEGQQSDKGQGYPARTAGFLWRFTGGGRFGRIGGFILRIDRDGMAWMVAHALPLHAPQPPVLVIAVLSAPGKHLIEAVHQVCLVRVSGHMNAPGRDLLQTRSRLR